MYDPALSIPLAGCKKKRHCYFLLFKHSDLYMVHRKIVQRKKKIQHDWTIENSNNQNFI